MKKRFLFRRVVALTFLIVFVQSFFQPYYALALTHGPHQPEFTAYEEPGATDMVNLLTGDFAFNLPILDVPGPEGGFAVPLTYNAGIGTEQQASWVGLGWNINVGAIVRNINEYPDDASGEQKSVTVKDLNVQHGWALNLGITQMGWDSQIGHYGNATIFGAIEISWNNGISAVGVAGFSVGRDGFAFDPVKFTIAAMSAATAGAGAAASAAGSVANSALSSLATDLAVGLAMASIVGASTPGAGTDGYLQMSKSESKSHIFPKWMRIANPVLNLYPKKKSYKIWLDQTRSEQMYGVLYLDNANKVTYSNSSYSYSNYKHGVSGILTDMTNFDTQSGTNRGAASDINYTTENTSYQLSRPSTFLAEDQYTVKAPGITGSIAPYRLETGSVAMPRNMTSSHLKMSPVSFIDYKVPFVYQGAQANAYFHQLGGASNSPSSPSFYFEDDYEVNVVGAGAYFFPTFVFKDQTLNAQRIKSNTDLTKQIPQGHHVNWFTNAEVKNAITYPSGYLDILDGGNVVSDNSERSTFRRIHPMGSTTSYAATPNLSNASLPVESSKIAAIQTGASGTLLDVYISIYTNETTRGEGITNQVLQFTGVTATSKTSNTINVPAINLSGFTGSIAEVEIAIKSTEKASTSIAAYTITNVSGTTYHFALPAYEYDNESNISNIVNSNTKFSSIKSTDPFANTWLLTAITGSDFIDRNNNGMADAADWGYWVKFHYGRHASDYAWRYPYADNEFNYDLTNTNKSYAKGKKQLHYLNAIETRSHIALFAKSDRLDGKSASVPYRFPLKLDQIMLLSKETYKTLIKPVNEGGYALPDYTSYTAQLDKVCRAADFSPSALTYAGKNLLKKVVFHYDYSLTPGTPNSNAPGGGKLTLKRLSIVGRNGDGSLLGNKIMPDYVFEYNNTNPSFSTYHWDAWGLYSAVGTQSGTSHKASTAVNSGREWSLSTIVTPQGSKIKVEYERDSYNSVSGNVVQGYQRAFAEVEIVNNTVVMNDLTNFKEGEVVDVNLEYRFTCVDPNCPEFALCGTQENVSRQIQATIMNGNAVLTETMQAPDYSCNSGLELTNVELLSAVVVRREKTGGDLRVKTIALEDEFGRSIKTQYEYKNGVIAQEPALVLGQNYAFTDYPDYPQTPVMYGEVSVMTGPLTTSTDYHAKVVYEFNTPDQNQYLVSKITTKEIVPLKMYKTEIQDRTSKIGTLKSVKSYSKNALVSSNLMTYSEAISNHQGVYANATYLTERVGDFYRSAKTSVIRYPYIHTKTTSSKDGFVGEEINEVWDFNTGIVTQSLQKSSTGIGVRNVTKLAYISYPELGSKASNISYKNMLFQKSEEWTYLTDNLGRNVGLLGANIQIWNKGWDYRVYDLVQLTYKNEAATDVWKRSESYTWKGDYMRLQSNGAHSYTQATDALNLADPSANALWQVSGAPTLFNHSSIMLESKNYNGTIYSTLKMGYDNRYKIAEASNARYSEIAFSGAEDLDLSNNYFGGEVALGNGTVLYKSKNPGTITHTGDAVVSVTTGQSFIYKNAPQASKPYRAAVWTNSIKGRIYYKYNNGAEQLSAAPIESKKVGAWYLLEVDLPTNVSSISSFEIGVKSSDGTAVLFDDFRYQPKAAVMTAYVQNPLNYEHDGASSVFEYVLNNDNLYTKYEYNNKGELVKTYQETLKYGEKLISELRFNYRRSTINP